jgi:methyl-accepting chemotaxis protein
MSVLERLQKLRDVSLEIKIVGLVIFTLIVASIAIGVMSIKFIRTDIYRLVDVYSGNSVDFIKDAIEETMLTGDALVTKGMIKRHEGRGPIETITILNVSGRDFFLRDKEPLSEDISAINEIKKGISRSVLRKDESIIYYTPLINTERCVKCHADDGRLIGVLKVSMSIKDATQQIIRRDRIIVLSLLIGTLLFGGFLWIVFRKTVIRPVKELENSVERLSYGDLSIRPPVYFKDEIGHLSLDLAKGMREVGKIINRVKMISTKIKQVTGEVEEESKVIIKGAEMETESFEKILKSVERLNRTMNEIIKIIKEITVLVEQNATAFQEMDSVTEEISKRTIDLSDAIDSTTSSIEQMSANIKEVAERAEELSASAEEAVTAIEEINSSIKEIELHTRESAKLSEKISNDVTGFGISAVEKTVLAMQSIKESIDNVADYIDVLTKRSEEIGKILNVINDITDQTTLLALNAAILAAQAGEHGKGFSVVADEIKDLAERTSMSTHEISSIIQSVQNDVKNVTIAVSKGQQAIEEGTKLTKEAKETFKKIMENVVKSKEMTVAIEKATSEQLRGIGFVTNTVEKIKGMISQTARATADHSQGVSQVIMAAEKIRDATGHVKTAIMEQAKEVKNLYESVETYTGKIREISDAIKEEKKIAENIQTSVSRISSFPKRNRDHALFANRKIRNLQKDAEILLEELNLFKVPSEEEKGIIRMGIIPLESPAEMHKRFSPLCEYLSRVIDVPVEPRIQADYETTIKEIGEGITMLCYMTPSTYIKSKIDYGVEVLVMALRDGKPFHHVAIIAREDNDEINSIQDIRGKTFAFGDILSTSSYIVPMAMLKDAGIELQDLNFYDFRGHHDDVVRAVLDGEFDAGGVMESVAQRYKREGLKFIKVSGNIPEFNICVNKNLSPEMKQRIKDALIGLDNNKPEDRAILQAISPHYTGFIEAKYEDYKYIEGLMAKLGML